MTDFGLGLLADFLPEKTLAAELGHHWRTLARWRKQRCGPPFVMNGKHIVYHRDDVTTWLRAGGIKNAAPKARTRKAR